MVSYLRQAQPNASRLEQTNQRNSRENRNRYQEGEKVLNLLTHKNSDCSLIFSALVLVNILSIGNVDASDAFDYDSDTVPNYLDNCIDVSNVDQADSDQNGTGDVCEGVGDPRADFDKNGVVDRVGDLDIFIENFATSPTPSDVQGADCRFQQPTLISPIDDTPFFEAQTLRWEHNPCAITYFVLVRDLGTGDTATNNIFGSQLTDKCTFEAPTGKYFCETSSIFNLVVNRGYEWCLTANTSNEVGGQLFETGPTQCFGFRPR